MTFTLEDVQSCEFCLDLANSATAQKLVEIGQTASENLLADVYAIHVMNGHEQRSVKLRTLERLASVTSSG